METESFRRLRERWEARGGVVAQPPQQQHQQARRPRAPTPTTSTTPRTYDGRLLLCACGSGSRLAARTQPGRADGLRPCDLCGETVLPGALLLSCATCAVDFCASCNDALVSMDCMADALPEELRPNVVAATVAVRRARSSRMQLPRGLLTSASASTSPSRPETLREWLARQRTDDGATAADHDDDDAAIPDGVLCRICCVRAVEQRVECGHLFCTSCCVRLLRTGGECPYDRRDIHEAPQRVYLV